MPSTRHQADLVLSGGGVLAPGHVGVASVLQEAGYRFERVAGTSAGSIVGSLLAAGMPADRLRELVVGLQYLRFFDTGGLDRIPLVGPQLSVLLENGYIEGRRFEEWIAARLEELGVVTFGDLRTRDRGADPRPEHRYRLVVMAADVTRGQLLRLPWDYERYGLDPDEQPVAAAVRASISVPYLFEPAILRYGGGESELVDGGLLSNYPIDVFDRSDGSPPRWPTFGATLIPQLPAGDTKLVPGVRALRLVPPFAFAESLIATTLAGNDQGYLAQPWVQARSMEVDNLGVNPFDFLFGTALAESLYESGRRAATDFLARWSFEDYLARYRPQPS
jgi:NTE family protein